MSFVEALGECGVLIPTTTRRICPRPRRPPPASRSVYVELCPRLEGVTDPLFEGEEAVLHVMGIQIASEKRRNPWTSRRFTLEESQSPPWSEVDACHCWFSLLMCSNPARGDHAREQEGRGEARSVAIDVARPPAIKRDDSRLPEGPLNRSHEGRAGGRTERQPGGARRRQSSTIHHLTGRSPHGQCP
jgi:hypothetical protein